MIGFIDFALILGHDPTAPCNPRHHCRKFRKISDPSTVRKDDRKPKNRPKVIKLPGGTVGHVSTGRGYFVKSAALTLMVGTSVTLPPLTMIFSDFSM